MKAMKVLLFMLSGVILINLSPSKVIAVEGDPIKFSVNIIGEYSDNRDSSEVKDNNFDTYINPEIEALIDLERTVLDFRYSPSYRIRSNPSDIQNDTELYHDLGANLEYKLMPRIKLNLDEKFNLTDDPSIQKGGTTLRRDSSYILNRVNAGVSFELNRRSLLNVSGNHMIKRFDENKISLESDEDSVGGEVSLLKQISKTLGVTFFGNVSDFGYAKGSNNIERGFSMLTGTIGLEKMFSNYLGGNLQIGLRSLSYDDNTINSDSGPYLALSVKGSTTPAMRIIFSTSYLLRDSDVYPFSSQTQTDFNTKLEWDASKIVTFNLAGTYRLGNYDYNSVPSQTPSSAFIKDMKGDEVAVIVNAEVICRINNDTRIKIAQQYEDRTSDVNTPFTRNATSLAFSKDF